MQPGEVVGERFRIERLARSGGMGDVYRAADEQSGDAVAIKVLQGNAALDSARFGREADVLSTRYRAIAISALDRETLRPLIAHLETLLPALPTPPAYEGNPDQPPQDLALASHP